MKKSEHNRDNTGVDNNNTASHIPGVARVSDQSSNVSAHNMLHVWSPSDISAHRMCCLRGQGESDWTAGGREMSRHWDAREFPRLRQPSTVSTAPGLFRQHLDWPCLCLSELANIWRQVARDSSNMSSYRMLRVKTRRASRRTETGTSRRRGAQEFVPLAQPRVQPQQHLK